MMSAAPFTKIPAPITQRMLKRSSTQPARGATTAWPSMPMVKAAAVCARFQPNSPEMSLKKMPIEFLMPMTTVRMMKTLRRITQPYHRRSTLLIW